MSKRLDKIKSILFNLPGWHTKRKIVVFESDDWGSIRTSSKEVYYYLLKQGFAIDKSPYGKDALESEEDVSDLLEVISGVKNKEGVNPIFTLNYIVANPDFEKIRNGNLLEYYYEPFNKTYNKYPNHIRVLELIKEGIVGGFLKPQLHGREHLNPSRWLKSLQEGQPETAMLFEKHMSGLPFSLTMENRKDFQRAFDHDDKDETLSYCEIISEACMIFREVWDYAPETFIAPNFFWDNTIEKCLFKNGIKILQGQRAQFLPSLGLNYKIKYHYTGQRNKLDQVYLIRNCYFEPSLDPSKDWVSNCLKEIENAFICDKPAIISMHRVNFIGFIIKSNRNQNLKLLLKLLGSIIKRWPEVEFMSSDQLGNLILNKS